jgi:hypothetical protein
MGSHRSGLLHLVLRQHARVSRLAQQRGLTRALGWVELTTVGFVGHVAPWFATLVRSAHTKYSLRTRCTCVL